ncbi:hypothetical protein PP182_07615 [Maribacter sp. PR1]|uniref:Uncharacterized protein n=1 Tax=Maribacter cobaltidurans TaxID=1178778 RepID=A0ABU7ISI1_9FLAO|nr:MULTISPECIES: hypothetical protein [Maribacter]MDC6388545.1 hypothetical protein [Maribacter sp. PR1]MEE1975934.1 hypothetical protein [Maribacter cobaltidurans]
MKNMKMIIAGLLFVSGVTLAQEGNSEVLQTTTTKTYNVDMGDKMVKRSVEVTTARENTIKHNEKDADKVDQTRITDSIATITKTVKIDNDEDDAFDEKIVFSYKSDTAEDFVLVSNADELVVAIDEGNSLKIVENMNLKSKETSGNRATYIFTDDKGKDVEFFVEEYNKAWDMDNSK